MYPLFVLCVFTPADKLPRCMGTREVGRLPRVLAAMLSNNALLL
jgi:hypothetical protein